MRRYLALMILFLMALPSWAAPIYLLGIRIQPSLQQTRLSFSLSQKTFGRILYFPNSQQIIIEFVNTEQHFKLPKTKLARANIKAVTVESSGNKLRYILQVKQALSWHTQFITKQNPQRVVLQVDFTNKSSTLKKNKTMKTTLTKQKNMPSLQKISTNAVQAPSMKQVDLPAQKQTTTIVVLDAGHGGNDSGARSENGLLEKNVVLAITKCLANIINKEKNTRVILTRNGDYFVPLRKRLQLARKGDADFFIAIHADGYVDDAAKGASVYALSQRGATSEAARWLAQHDNYPELGNVQLQTLQDHSPMLRSVLIDLAQTATIRDSVRLGNKVLDALDEVSSLHYKQVEQAPFMVLKSPDIPSILIETGFITNPWEAKRLADPTYQQQLAQAIWRGIKQYIKQYQAENA